MNSIKAASFGGIRVAGPAGVPADAVAAVIGAGYCLGSAVSGTENGPYFIRTLSKAFTWSSTEPTVFDLRDKSTPLGGAVDLGDVDFGELSLPAALAALTNSVLALPPGVIPAVLGGDHTVTAAVIEALVARRSSAFTVVQFDHHLDLQTWTPVAAERDPIFNTNVMSHISDRVGPGRVMQVGVSPYATFEAADASGLAAYLHSVGRQVPVMSATITDRDLFATAIGTGQDVYLTVDVDVLDEQFMSSTGYPAEVGLSVPELVMLIDTVLTGNRLIGFDVVEFGAPRDARDRKTLNDAHRAALVFLHLLGWAARQRAAAPGDAFAARGGRP